MTYSITNIPPGAWIALVVWGLVHLYARMLDRKRPGSMFKYHVRVTGAVLAITVILALLAGFRFHTP